jgi:GH24 family phage-related lysozyme (muramidase)
MIQRQLLAVNLIASCEGLRLNAYLDSRGIPTIGFGTIVYPNGVKVKMGDKITSDQAKSYLNDHLEKFVYPAVNKLIGSSVVPDKVYAALCSIAYNNGTGILLNNSFIAAVGSKNWGTFKDNGDGNFSTTGLASVFIQYIKVRNRDGVLVPCDGLINRRVSEIKSFV